MILPEELLKQNGLSKTNVRVKVLDILLRNQCALSEAELKEMLGDDCDRTTVYRTLKTFEKASILYKLAADDGVVRYFIDSRKAQHRHNHLHFRCVECNRLECMEDAPISPYQLPNGYTALKNNFIIVGLCASCDKDKT